MALDSIGVENVVIAQNKVDLVDRDAAVANAEEIEEFVAGTVAEDAPVVPISAGQEINLDLLIAAIEDEIPTPERDPDADARFHIARSFDINRPGTAPADLRGGVLGGTLSQGELAVDDEIEIRPGREVDDEWESVTTAIRSLRSGNDSVDRAGPGGLLGAGTGLDPSLTKGDALAGQIAGPAGDLPPTRTEFTMTVDLLDRVVGEDGGSVDAISTGEPLMLTVGTATTVGSVTSAREDACDVALKRPVCAEDGARVAINRRVGSRWRLIGVGTLDA
jgi:translation initiation factor 2 subunit 3